MTATSYTTRTRFRVRMTNGWTSEPNPHRPGQTRSVPDYTGSGRSMTPRQILSEYGDLRRVSGQGAFLGCEIIAADGILVCIDDISTIVMLADVRTHNYR